jgi:hypothetical protein
MAASVLMHALYADAATHGRALQQAMLELRLQWCQLTCAQVCGSLVQEDVPKLCPLSTPKWRLILASRAQLATTRCAAAEGSTWCCVCVKYFP